MSNTLVKVQKVSKVCEVISKIIAILCIIGAVASLFCIFTFAFGLNDGVLIDGVTMQEYIEQETNCSINQLYILMTILCITCVVESVIAFFADAYFKHELVSGTPFTESGSKEMFRLGVITLCLSFGASIVTVIVAAIMSKCLGVDVNDSYYGMEVGSIAMGLVFMALSLVFRHGAELSGNTKEQVLTPFMQEEKQEEVENFEKIKKESEQEQKEVAEENAIIKNVKNKETSKASTTKSKTSTTKTSTANKKEDAETTTKKITKTK